MKKKKLTISILIILSVPSYTTCISSYLVGRREDLTERLEKYEKYYEKKVSKPKKNSRDLIELVNINLQQKDFMSAEKYYFMLDYNDSYETYKKIVDAYGCENKKNSPEFEEFIKNEMNYKSRNDFVRSAALLELANIYIKKKDFDLAVNYYGKATEFNVDSKYTHRVYLEIVSLGFSKNYTDELINFLNKELETKNTPYYLEIYNAATIHIIDAYLRAENFQEATRRYDTALSIIDNEDTMRADRLKDISDRLYLRKTIDENLKRAENNDNESYRTLSVLYFNQLNDRGTAEKYRMLAIQYGNTQSMKGLAKEYYDTGDYVNAEKYYKMAADKGDIDAMGTLGVVYEEHGKIQSAEKYYKMAADKGEINAIIDLGLLYQSQGKIQAAKNYFQKAVKKGADYTNIAERYNSTYRINKVHYMFDGYEDLVDPLSIF